MTTLFDLGEWLGKVASLAATAFIVGVFVGAGWHGGRKLGSRFFGPETTLTFHRREGGDDH